MDLQASKAWLQEYLDGDFSAKQFSKEVTAKAFPVDYTRKLKDQFEGMVLGVVKELKAHPDADKLQVVVTDIGKETVEIVCGGNNLQEGMRVFVALPGAQVRWHGEGDLVTLKETKIRGVASFGMICAPSEVGFEKAPCPEGGIWDLTDWTEAEAGTPIVEALELDDVMFDVEITTNRPDAMGIVGLAREAGAAMNIPLRFEAPSLPEGSDDLALDVRVEDLQGCPRYMAVVIDGVKVGPSPTWLQKRLLLAGHRPINNIVDITNYVLREYGQPLHAFDYDKLEDGTIVVRKAKEGEEILALDDETYALDKRDIVISDGKAPIAVAGVMGGKVSGTWEGTTRIVFEAATFDPLSIRKTARRLNLYSDSQLLFEKGLSPQAPALALARAIELTLDIAGGRVASAVVDCQQKEYEPIVYSLRPDRVRGLIGVDISDEQMVDYLERVGFSVEASDGAYTVTVPFWRDHDIEHEVDLTEEIARLYGYHNMPIALPESPPPTTPEDPQLRWEMRTKHLLQSAGFTEFYGYSMVSADDLKRYGLSEADAVALYNPLSSELTHMRTSLMPSLLRDIEKNQGERPEARVFELQRIYQKRSGDVPDERTEIVLAHYGQKDVPSAFKQLKGVLSFWFDQVGIEVEIKRLEGDDRWHPTRSAQLYVDGECIGRFGQVSESCQQAFDIDRPVVAAQIDFEAIVPRMHLARRYEPIPAFPAVERDIAVLVDEKTTYQECVEVIETADTHIETVSLIDVYRGKGIPDGKKSLTFALRLRSEEKTLDSSRADEVMQNVATALESSVKGIIR